MTLSTKPHLVAAPIAPTTAPDDDHFDADVLVIGSGFGGAVSALRSTEKGHRVIVLESGQRWKKTDFPKSNWHIWRFLWMPRLALRGFFSISWLSDVMILRGTGVGGGSLVYANTLLVPPPPFFKDPKWVDMANWSSVLSPHYDLAKRMLGVSRTPAVFAGDDLLREYAEAHGRGHTFKHTDVGIFFGPRDEEVSDPYFGGDGPARTGCTFCGGCMVGCNVGAKNTLDQNYLYFAERNGAKVIANTHVTDVRPIDGGYEVSTSRSDRPWFPKGRTFRARKVIFSAGVLGTVRLLLDCKRRGTLPKLSEQLGEYVRTNSEAIIAVTGRDDTIDHSEGIAIASGFYPDDETHIEAVRYPRGSGLLSGLATLLTDGGGDRPRALRFLGNVVRQPVDFLRTLSPFNWAERTVILLVMQTSDNWLRVRLKRRWWWPFEHSLVSAPGPGQKRIPTYIPIAHTVARWIGERANGIPCSSINEVLLDIPTTAHILGGAAMGPDATSGVIDGENRVYGYEGLYVVDGSMIPANLGVNPSLTITAMAEHAMKSFPKK